MRNTTYVDLFDFHELECSYSKCYSEIDVLSPKRSKFKCHNQKKCNQCKQPCDPSFATNSSKTLFHAQVCDYLGIETTATIEDEFKYVNASKNLLKTKVSSHESLPIMKNVNTKGKNQVKTLLDHLILIQSSKSHRRRENNHVKPLLNHHSI